MRRAPTRSRRHSSGVAQLADSFCALIPHHTAGGSRMWVTFIHSCPSLYYTSLFSHRRDMKIKSFQVKTCHDETWTQGRVLDQAVLGAPCPSRCKNRELLSKQALGFMGIMTLICLTQHKKEALGRRGVAEAGTSSLNSAPCLRIIDVLRAT